MGKSVLVVSAHPDDEVLGVWNNLVMLIVVTMFMS